jgi:succinyl-diaminopimelate desuccinylase
VPGELKCRCNLRYSNVWTPEALSARIEALLRELKIDYEIRWRVAGLPFLTKGGALTAAVRKAVSEETGLDPELSTSGGTSDGRFIAPYGVDVIEVGPLNATIHSVDELVAIEDLATAPSVSIRIAEPSCSRSDALSASWPQFTATIHALRRTMTPTKRHAEPQHDFN